MTERLLDFIAGDIRSQHECNLCGRSSYFAVTVVFQRPTLTICLDCIEKMKRTILDNLAIEGRNG